MKKIISILLSSALLASGLMGCGSSNTSNSNVNDSQQQENYSDASENILTMIATYNTDLSEQSITFSYAIDDEYFLSGDITDNRDIRCVKLYNNSPGQEVVITGETKDRIRAAYRELYDTFIAPHMDEFKQEFLKRAKEHAANKTADLAIKEYPDLQGKISKELVLKINDVAYKLNPTDIVFYPGYPRQFNEEPVGSSIPYWKDEEGKYHYLEGFQIQFAIPNDQLSPMYEFFNSAVEEQEQKPLEQVVAEEKVERESKNTENSQPESTVSDNTQSGNVAIGQPLSFTGFGGLYSGSNNGQYYYIWIDHKTNTSEPLGTATLLWKGSEPYADGTPLLLDGPGDLYLGEVDDLFLVKPGFDGEASTNMGIDSDEYGNYSGKIFCYGFFLERDNSLFFDGTTMWHK